MKKPRVFLKSDNRGSFMSLEQRVSQVENKVETLIINVAEIKVELSHVSTKAGLIELKGDLDTKMERVKGELETKIESFKGELETKIESFKGELETKIESFKGELETKIESFKGELETKIEKSRNSIVMWLIGVAISIGLMNHFIPPHDYDRSAVSSPSVTKANT